MAAKGFQGNSPAYNYDHPETILTLNQEVVEETLNLRPGPLQVSKSTATATATATTQGSLEIVWPKQALAAFILPSFIEGRQRGQSRELLPLAY